MGVNQAEKKGITVELRERRMEAHMTQTQLAEKIGISRSYLGQIERGVALPLVDLANDIAKACRCTTFDIWKKANPGV